MNYFPINLKETLSKFDNHRSPRVLAKMNDYRFKLVKIQGEFVWHEHPHTDEVFIVIDGLLDIEFRDGKVSIAPGEMFVVPKAWTRNR
ncbi:MAG: mannose-6-phosphate isomerase-like protein (cupin superfamily) [Gammaproteobacteria bacterium]|jgi:mannose-6-phosphate isomerase-like protein (cupin superfamily)